MTQYINKSALVAEIENRKKEAESNCGGYKSYDEHRCNACIVGFYEEFLEILNTLEVKDVDLEEEVDKWYIDEAPKEFENILYSDIENFAKYFFELGLRAQKGESV